MITKTKIAIIEDDREIRVLLKDYLLRNDFRVETFDGGAAYDRFRDAFGEPDLIVLDLMLPGEDGLSICRRIRSSSRVPIIILTAKGEEIDRIIGLELGADDYLAKPFNPRELLARIKAILRRCEPPPLDHQRLQVLDLVIDLDARSVEFRNPRAHRADIGRVRSLRLPSQLIQAASSAAISSWIGPAAESPRVSIAPSMCNSAVSERRSKERGKSSSRPSEMQAMCSPNP